MERTSHALVLESGAIWLIDPIDCRGLDAALKRRGRVSGIVVTIDRHTRDAVAVAERHAVPIVVPDRHTARSVGPRALCVEDAADQLDELEIVPVATRGRWWTEVAVWWPAHFILVVGESLGAASYFKSVLNEPVAVHPMTRLLPPRSLAQFEPDVLLVSHGDPVLRMPDLALHLALAESVSELPMWSGTMLVRGATAIPRALVRRVRR